MLIDPVFSITLISNSREGPSVYATLKRWQMYENDNSITFFYSEIEHCWLIHVNSGFITINGFLPSEDTIIIENTARIGIGCIIFQFTNLSSRCSLSKILAGQLIKHRSLSMKSESVLKIIQSNITVYKDSFFIFDIVRQNPIFTYRYGELVLNPDILYNDVLLDKSSFNDSIKFEYNNSFVGKPFSVSGSSILNCPSFHAFNKEGIQKPMRFQWPRREVIEKYISNSSDESGSFNQASLISKSSVVSKESVSSQSSIKNSRYINSYIVKSHNDLQAENVRRTGDSSNEETQEIDGTEGMYDEDYSDTMSSMENSNSTDFVSTNTGTRKTAHGRDFINKSYPPGDIRRIRSKSIELFDDPAGHLKVKTAEIDSYVPKKRKCSITSNKKAKYSFQLDFATVNEDLVCPDDSENSAVSFYSDAETYRLRKKTKKYRSGSFVEHEILSKRQCYKGYLPNNKLRGFGNATRDSSSTNDRY